MYTPYGNIPKAEATGGATSPYQESGYPGTNGGNLRHPQPQHPNLSHSNFQGGPPTGDPNQFYSNFFQDPTTSMAAQFAKSSFGHGNEYIQQNFGSFIPATSNLNYYFQISNGYVVKKLALILFPYKHSNWNRLTNINTPGPQGATPGASTVYSAPTEDINAPDLYIPFMSYVTYILLWAVFQGLKGDFHPQLFGYLSSKAFACLVFDISLLRVGLYVFNCSGSGLFWDTVSFCGYKYVPIIVLLIFKHLVSNGWLFYAFMVLVIANFGLFLMRSLRYLILPSSTMGATNSLSPNQRRERIMSLAIYSIGIQGLIIIFMNW